MGAAPQPLLLAHLAGVVLAAGALSIVPSPPNIRYIFSESSCTLSIQWDPLNISSNFCELYYHTALYDGKTWTKNHWIRDLSQKIAVPLGENVHFGHRTTCLNNTHEVLKGEWFNISLAQNGTPGTGAANLSCICYNAKAMVCSWKRGRNASVGINYYLYFWYESLEAGKLCTNHRVEGDTFSCTFAIPCFGNNPIAISVRSHSQGIQPVCMITKEGPEKPDYQIKLDPPSNLRITQGNNLFFLTWTSPINWRGICYEIEINDKIEVHEDRTNVTVRIEPNKSNTVRVRAVLDDIGGHCSKKRGPWSEWSEKVHWDNQDKNETLTIVLFVLIPLCAAILTVILLIYLKRIQLLIFPKIPDPEKVLKRMFEDQKEVYQSVGHPSEFIRSDIMSR